MSNLVARVTMGKYTSPVSCWVTIRIIDIFFASVIDKFNFTIELERHEGLNPPAVHQTHKPLKCFGFSLWIFRKQATVSNPHI